MIRFLSWEETDKNTPKITLDLSAGGHRIEYNLLYEDESSDTVLQGDYGGFALTLDSGQK